MSDKITLGSVDSVQFDAAAVRDALSDADPDEHGHIGGRVGTAGPITIVGDGYNDGDLVVSNGDGAKFSSVERLRNALDEVGYPTESFRAYLEDNLGNIAATKLADDEFEFPGEADMEYRHAGFRNSATIGRSRGNSLDECEGARISYTRAVQENNGDITVYIGLEDVRGD
jgi:hypothetical protein